MTGGRQQEEKEETAEAELPRRPEVRRRTRRGWNFKN